MKNEVNTAITKNYSISILRVVGMFSIVFCHFFLMAWFFVFITIFKFWSIFVSFYFWFFVCKQKYS